MARKNLLKGFKKPKGITFEHQEQNPNYGKFTAYPFEPGFGTTVGNTLRSLLSRDTQSPQFRLVLMTQMEFHILSPESSNQFRIFPKIRWKS